MSVTIDDLPLSADQLGLKTVGQLLSHVARENRLVVHVLIDGEEPDLNQMTVVRAVPLLGRTVYVETADPTQMAIDVLADVTGHLAEADELRAAAVDALAAGQPSRGMQKLNACFSIWQHAQQSVVQTAQLLRMDLGQIIVDDGPQTIVDVLSEFAAQLRGIKSALESRDFVTLSDVLTYEMEESAARWTAAVAALRNACDGGACSRILTNPQ